MPVSAQKAQDTYQKQIDDFVASLDVSGIKNSLLLNKSAFTTDELEYFRKPKRNRKGQIMANITVEEWKSLYDRLAMADLRKNANKIPDVSTLAEQDPEKQSLNNVIPIGILNLDAYFLTEEQIEDNKKEKQKGSKAKSEKYEKIFFLAASVLQKAIYQADVSFRISHSLHISNNKNDVKLIEIDFQDGKGYRSFDLKEQSIPYRFTSTGERIVSIRVYTKRGTYVFHSLIDVKQLVRPKIHREFSITAAAIRQDTISTNSRLKNGRVGVSVPGGNVRVILGCDQVFDKPIIVAEGFDIGEDVTLATLTAEYTQSLLAYTNLGYDLVLLDYHNARDFIENNAQVLKNLIVQVNSQKVGNEQLIVIGESMSGLVARWALREMENQGTNHNVRLFIAYDSPHQGANVPVSVTQIYWKANPSFLTNVFLRIFSSLGNYYSAIQTPAATQMLLHYGTNGLGGVGNPHPEFFAFRNRLQALGNGGYPQNCRNIAMINGSMDASDRNLFTRYNYGSNIITSRLVAPFLGPATAQFAYIEAYTNQINNNSRILNFWANGVYFSGGALIDYNSAFNHDFVPGGRTGFSIPRRFVNSNDAFDFCFVPTFSSIDFQGPRNTQNDMEFLNVNLARTNGQTPFAAIYGRINNSLHAVAGELPWVQLGFSENLINFPFTCPAVPPPPTPFFSQGNVPCLMPSYTDPASVVVNLNLLSSTQGQYVNSWSVQPTGQFNTTTGDNFNFSVSEPGQYTVICTRSFPNRPDLNSSASVVVTVNYCSEGGNSTGTCGYLDWDFAYVLDNGQSVYARYHNGTLYALAANGDTYEFVSRSTLLNNGMFGSFASCFAETDPRGGGGNNLPFQNGCYTLKSKLSNKMMQMDNDGNGARVRQYNANGQNNQIFKLESVDGDAYKIMAATSNRTIEAPNGNTGYGTELQLWDYNGGNHQKWQFVNMNDGSYRLNPKHTNQMVMDVSNNNTNDGNLIHLWGIHNGDNQRFVFQSVGCPGGGSTDCFSASANYSGTPSCGGSINLTSNCSGDCNGVSYSWTGPNGFTSNAEDPTNAPVPNSNGTHTYTVTMTKSGCNTKTASTSVTVSGCGGSGGGCVVNKVRLRFRADCCQDRLNGATIQGSNDGNNWNTLYTINQNGTGNWQEFTFGNSAAYNRVRFVASGGGYGELWELQFYNGGTQLGGTAFGSDNSGNALDGNEGTFWHGSSPGTHNHAGLILSGCSGGCTPPSPPTVSANPSSISSGGSSTLTATGCSGTVTWSTGQTGASINVSPSSTTSYTATCTANGCTSGNSNTATVTVSGGGSGGGCVVNKVRLIFRDPGGCCMDRLVGATIQGNNNGNWTTLYTFTQNGTGNWQEFTFGNSTAYQQVRFVASSSGWGELMELEFYDGNTKLSGTTFGSDNYQNAFDGNSTTQWHAPNAPGPQNVAGLTLSGCGEGSSGSCVVNKVRLIFRDPGGCCMDRLIGAQIQGNNNGNWTSLYTFNQNGNGNWQEFTFGNSTAYQQVRFVASSSGWGELMELEFYNGNTKLSGTTFGSDNYQNAFDGNSTTQWHAPNAPGPQNVAGLTLSGCGGGGSFDVESQSIESKDEITLYPNPTDGRVTLRYYLEEGQKAALQFVNPSGQVLTQKTLKGASRWATEATDLSAQPNGTYMLLFEAEKRKITKKFVIAK